MSYALGVDIGTSFVTTAIARRGNHDADTPAVHAAARFPSTVFVDADSGIHVGDAAERRGSATPARLVRGIIGRIGDSVPIVAGLDRIAPERAYALLVRSAIDRVTAGEGSAPAAIRIAVPDRWGPHRRTIARSALAAVGLGHVGLVSAASAVVTTWTAGQTTPSDAPIAVYDLSAGRFGISVLRVHDGRTVALAVDGIDLAGSQHVGGGVVDDRILRHVVASARDSFAGFDTTAPESAEALAALRHECVRAKEALATKPAVTIAVRLPASSVDLLLDRRMLDRISEPTVRTTIDVVRRALRTAQVDAAELAAILTVGGSSRLAVVPRLLGAEFDSPVVTDDQSVATTARGAALLAVAEIGTAGEPDATGPDATGPDATGPDSTGPDATGPGATGPDSTGPDATGPYSTDPDATGPDGTDATPGDPVPGHPSRIARLRRRVAIGAAAVAAAMTTIVGAQSAGDDDSGSGSDASGTAG